MAGMCDMCGAKYSATGLLKRRKGCPDSRQAERGEGHDAEDALLSFAIPAAEKAGIEIVRITWGISSNELSVLPLAIFRIFRWDEHRLMTDKNSGQAKEVRCALGVRDGIGDIEIPNGATVPAGRMLIRDQRSTDLHEPPRRAVLRRHRRRISSSRAG